MKRLNEERHKELEPRRMQYAKKQLDAIGINYICDEKKIQFIYKGKLITLFPFTGWFTGKSIKDGRGINNLLIQLK